MKFQGSSFNSFFKYFADNIASIYFFKRPYSGQGNNPVEKQICVSLFFMSNPYKKFQNSSMHGSKVMLIKKRDGWTNRRTNAPEAICPSNFFEVGGIKACKNARMTESRGICRDIFWCQAYQT